MEGDAAFALRDAGIAQEARREEEPHTRRGRRLRPPVPGAHQRGPKSWWPSVALLYIL